MANTTLMKLSAEFVLSTLRLHLRSMLGTTLHPPISSSKFWCWAHGIYGDMFLMVPLPRSKVYNWQCSDKCINTATNAATMITARFQDALEIAIELKRTWAYICRRDTEQQSSLTFLLPRSQSYHSDGRRQQVAEIRSPGKST